MAKSLEMYIDAAGDEIVAAIHKKVRKLYGKHNVQINSTFLGGGVAEILSSTIPLLNDAGLDTGWRTVHGNQNFYEITKKIHNAMQGNPEGLSDFEQRFYLDVNKDFSIYSHFDHDFIIIHDPQPLPLIRYFKKTQPWIWRCHIDITAPNKTVWSFLKRYMLRYDVIVVSSKKYLKPDLPVEQRIIHPAIDPLSMKNKELSRSEIFKYIKAEQIPTDKPIITQVSRMDPWKDPEGVLEVFEQVKKKVDCRLLFCYNLASDDPEGMQVFERVYEKAKEHHENGDVIFVVGNNALLVNAIQRHSAVIIQKSLKEGFCLTVTEAMWKGKPVVASTAGGIPEQITSGDNGYLVEPEDITGCADRVVELLKNPGLQEEMGTKAKETVRKKFLTTRLMLDYINLMVELK
ncbi:MAG: glycosyltransferase [Spirochaetia bacterium]